MGVLTFTAQVRGFTLNEVSELLPSNDLKVIAQKPILSMNYFLTFCILELFNLKAAPLVCTLVHHSKQTGGLSESKKSIVIF